MKKRVLSFLLALVMIISMLPTSAIALSLGSGTEEDPYQVGSTVTNDGSAEPEGSTVENTHWVKTEEAAAVEKLVCQLNEHDHEVAACEATNENVACLLEGHPTEGELTVFTHEDGTDCFYDAENAKWMTSVTSGYTCGIENHTHTVEAGCIEVTPAYAVWTLTQNEQASPPAYNEMSAPGVVPLAETEDGRLPIHFFLASPGNITNPDGTYTNYYVPLNDNQNEAWTIANIKNDEAWSTMYTQNGIRNVADEDIIRQYVGSWPNGGEAAFKDFGSVRIGGVTYYDTDYEIKWVSIMCRDNSHSSSGMRCNQSSYRGEHIHIDGLLVEKIQPGEMKVYKTIPNALDVSTSFQFKLQKMRQPTLTTPPTAADDFDNSFTPMTLTATIPAGQTQAQIVGDSQITFGYYKLTEIDSPDWHNAGIALTDASDRTQVVDANALYICIAPNGTVQYSTRVSGPYTVLKHVAIQNERQTVTVRYQWHVYNLDGSFSNDLPANLGANSLPASVNGVEVGTEFVYNTGYVQGTSYHDYDNGLLYTFHGWDTWSHNSAWNIDATAEGYYELDDGDHDASNNKTIPITADTWINGYWTVSELPAADAYLMVHKNVVVTEGGDVNYVKDYLQNVGEMFISIDPGFDKDGDGQSEIDVGYPGATAEGGYRINVYQYNKPFIFDEHQMDVPGYTRTTEISTSGSNLSLVSEDGNTVTGTHGVVSIQKEYDPEQAPYNLGTVTYTNTYTKNTGSNVSEYPELTLIKLASDTGDYQDNVTFGLYRDEACLISVSTYTTTSTGAVVIPFDNMPPGTYYLKELTPAPGYIADSSIYKITLTAGETKEEMRWNEAASRYEYVQVTYYTLNMDVPEESDAIYSENKTANIYYRLFVYNDPIVGSLEVTKETTGLTEEDKTSLNAVVIVHGPVTRDSSNAITDIGSTWTMNLNTENGWKDSISNLPVGEYLIHESFASVHGYTWTSVNYGSLTTVEYNGITSGLFEISKESTADHSIDLTLSNTYTEWESADFYIKKIDPSGKALADATFEIFTDANCTTKATANDISGENVTLFATTKADGYAEFKGYTVPEGRESIIFYLKETKAPTGYYLDSTVYKVEIKATPNNTTNKVTYEPKITKADGTEVDFTKDNDLLEVTNSPVLGKLTITKAFANGIPVDDKGDALISSVKVIVSGPNGYTNTVELSQSNLWSVTLEKLPLGTYTLTEQNASVPGYDWDISYSGKTVIISEDNPGYTVTTDVISNSVSITNTYTKLEENYEIPTTLTIKKVGEDGITPLAGAVFELDRISTDGKTVVETKTYTTNAEGIAVFDLLRGWIVNNDDVIGTYILSETKAPEGYQRATETWTVTIKDDDGNLRVTLNKDKNIFENFWDWIVGGITGKQDLYTFNDNVLTVKNIELADLTVTKTFDTETAKDLPIGAVIEVAVFDSSDNLVSQLELSESNNWTAQVKDIPAGTYTVRENSPSLHGYTWQSAKFTVTGVDTKDVTTAASSVTVKVAESADVKVNIQNTYTKWDSADFYVMKTRMGSATPLAGATFMLYDAAGNDVTSQYLHVDKTIHTYTTNTTGSGGILHFHNFDVDDGKTATFTLKETSAPANYYSNGNVYYITVSHDKNSYDIKITGENGNELTIADNKAAFNSANDVLTVVNDEILADIVIEKSFTNSDLTLTSVKVDVTGPNGYNNTVTLDNSNAFKVTLAGLSLGEYTIKEQEAAKAGYSLTVKYNDQILEDGESYKVNLTTENDNAAATVKIQNTYVQDIHNPASFQIKKVDSATKGVITTGAQFTLYSDASCTVPVQVQTTDENGIATFTGFTKAATYFLKESIAPAGYETVGTVWKVKTELKNGQPTIQVNDTTKLWETIYDWIVGSINPDSQWANGVLTVENVKRVGGMKITKTVTDLNNYYKDATYSFTLTLSDRTDPVTFTLTKGAMTKTIENIPWGTTYTLTENTTGAAFTSSIDSPSGTIWADNTEITVMNTYAYQTHNNGLNIVKVDADDNSKIIAGAGFTLYSDVDCKTKVGTEVISGTDGKLHFDIPTAGTYYLKETTTPTGYHTNDDVYVVNAVQKEVVLNAGTANAVTEIQMHITIEGMTGTTSNQIDYTYSIENTAIKTVVVTVEKLWDDSNYHARPDSVEVTLYRDNESYETKTLNADNNWSYTWNNLTDEYSWSVDEVNVPNEYTKSVTNSGNNWTITNARTPVPVEITVTKAWNHNGGKNLPDSIGVTLYKNGTAYQTIELSEENNWTHTWFSLNDASVWSIDETEVPTGYDKKIEVDGYKFKIINTRFINPVEIHVKKVWVASEGAEHPESIEVVLYRDGKKHDAVKLSEENGWAKSWTGLTDEYTWTVDEKEVPTGYTKNVEVKETVTEGKYSYDWTITNTKNFKYIDVSVKKIWNGSGVTHPTSVKVTLYRNGVAYDTITLSATNNWEYIWEDLTDEFEWEVDEPSVPSGYNKTVRVYDNYSYYISNTHEDNPKTGDFTNILGLGTLGMVGIVGFVYTAFLLLVPRKKGKYQR